MRTASLLVVAAAAVAHAGYTEKDGKYYCEESNASYCLGGDIILRCDAYGVGTPGRCSDNNSGYSPASCSEKVHGEATCEVRRTLSSMHRVANSACQPSQPTLTTIYTHPVPETTTKPYYNTTIHGYPGQSSKPGQPEESSKPGHHNYPSNSTQPGQPGHPTATGYTTKCVTIVYPNPTKSGESSTRTITYTTAVYPPGTETETETGHPHYPPQTTMYPVPSGGIRPPHNGTYGGPGGKGIYGEQNNGQQASPNGDNTEQKGVEAAASETESNVPVKPTSTAEPETVTGAGVATTPVSGLLALAAVVAAYLI